MYDRHDRTLHCTAPAAAWTDDLAQLNREGTVAPKRTERFSRRNCGVTKTIGQKATYTNHRQSVLLTEHMAVRLVGRAMVSDSLFVLTQIICSRS